MDVTEAQLHTGYPEGCSTYALLKKKVNYILDADIRSFFDNLDKSWLMKFMEHRVADPRILRLIRKWLKAGVMEEGKWSEPQTGTPQGSVISPLLANVYLHYAFDLWVNVWRTKGAQGNFSISRTRIASWKIYGSDWLSLDWNFTRTRRGGSSSGGLPSRTENVEEKRNRKRSTF